MWAHLRILVNIYAVGRKGYGNGVPERRGRSRPVGEGRGAAARKGGHRARPRGHQPDAVVVCIGDGDHSPATLGKP